MLNQDKLEVIKEESLIDALEWHLGTKDEGCIRIIEDIEWLIQQAEKIEKYEKALEFYASDKNHESPIYDEHGEFRGSLVDKDGGMIAQEALGMFD